jgi:enoyl-CoA hydratase
MLAGRETEGASRRLTRDLQILDSEALAAAAAYGAGPDASPLGGTSCIVCRPERGLDEGEARRTAAWLRRAPCPVIALPSGAADPRLTDACDVVLDDRRGLDGLVASIATAPLAAMVLVQVLRATEGLAPDQALVVESMAFATLQAGPEFKAWRAARGPAPAAPEPETPLLVRRDGGTLRLTFNRPGRRNAINRAVRDALVEALALAEADETIETIELDGAGRCFSIGGELEEFGQTPDPATAHVIRTLRSPAMGLARVARRLIARVHGVSVGAGVEFAAFADRVLAAPSASFQLPELSMGLIPGAGGCISIPRRIGRQRAAWLALSGRRISAATALDWGLVDAIETAAQDQ